MSDLTADEIADKVMEKAGQAEHPPVTVIQQQAQQDPVASDVMLRLQIIQALLNVTHALANASTIGLVSDAELPPSQVLLEAIASLRNAYPRFFRDDS